MIEAHIFRMARPFSCHDFNSGRVFAPSNIVGAVCRCKQMFVGVSSLFFLSLSPFLYLSQSFLSFVPLPILCASHIYVSRALSLHPLPFINHQLPLTGRQCFKCQFLFYFRKTCNYHFSPSEFSLLRVKQCWCLSFLELLCIHWRAEHFTLCVYTLNSYYVSFTVMLGFGWIWLIVSWMVWLRMCTGPAPFCIFISRVLWLCVYVAQEP